MRSLTLWTNNSILAPWRMELRRNLDWVVDEAWSDEREDRTIHETFVRPACDVEETESHYLMSLDLPGVAKKDISIEMKDGHLLVTAERKSASNHRKFSERYFGKFQRIVPLPTGIDAEKIEAQYQDGVLRLAVAKAETAKARQIKISDGKSSFFGRFVGSSNEKQDDTAGSGANVA